MRKIFGFSGALIGWIETPVPDGMPHPAPALVQNVVGIQPNVEAKCPRIKQFPGSS